MMKFVKIILLTIISSIAKDQLSTLNSGFTFVEYVLITKPSATRSVF